jgi:putative hemolysin
MGAEVTMMGSTARRQAYRILSRGPGKRVEFECRIQRATDGRFSVPVEVCDHLGGIGHGSWLHLRVVQKAKAVAQKRRLKSGREVYGPDFSKFRAGSRVRITAWI